MSEQAQVFIKAALRAIGAIASGETPTDSELADGLEAMQLMLRHWGDRNIRIYAITQKSHSMTGAEYYTIGNGGDLDVLRPSAIKGAYIDQNKILQIIDEAKFRIKRISSLTGDADYLWYSSEYPLGKIYVLPTGGTTLYLDLLNPLTEIESLTSLVEYPPGYDEAIKWNLAVRLALEYGKEPSPAIIGLAKICLEDIETRNFSEQINAVRVEVSGLLDNSSGYDINSDD